MKFLYCWAKPEGLQYSLNRELADKILHSGHFVRLIPLSPISKDCINSIKSLFENRNFKAIARLNSCCREQMNKGNYTERTYYLVNGMCNRLNDLHEKKMLLCCKGDGN